MNGIVWLLRIAVLASAVIEIAPAQSVILTALNGASSSGILSPGSWMSIYGSNFTAASQTAQPGSGLPMTLGGASVTVGGMPASLSYVSPTQINALIPLAVTIPSNTVVPVAVTTVAGSGSYKHPHDARYSGGLHPGWQRAWLGARVR